MATMRRQDNRPIDLTVRLARHGETFRFPSRGARLDRVRQAAIIIAGCGIAIAILILGWFVLLTMMYDSFARPFH